jgi:hypothetical protein
MLPRFWWRNLKEDERLLYMRSFEDIIKMYVKDMKWEVVERILLVSVGTSSYLF